MNKRDDKDDLESPSDPKKRRKDSFSEYDFENALQTIYGKIRIALAVIPPDVLYVLCFSGSLVVRAMHAGGLYRDECRKYLKDRYKRTRRITSDCDVIFAEDPSEELQTVIKLYQENLSNLEIDWWPSTTYVNKWGRVKRKSLKYSETILDVPCQPIDQLYYAKTKLLFNVIKHQNDIKHLPKPN
jgi:hypothetical protein